MVRLPQYIGFNIRNTIDKYRRDNNIPEPDEVRKLYNRYDSFLEEELSYITKLTISNDILSYLEYFPNLTEIRIDSEREMTQTDINRIINMFPNLKSLSIVEQNSLQSIDVGSLSQLEELYISSNRHLKNIFGLEKLKKMYSLTVYDNQTLSETSIKNVIEQMNRLINELGTQCNIDVLYMPDFMEYINNNGISLELIKDFIVWSEHIKSGVEMKNPEITHTTSELYVAYKKAVDVINRYIKQADTPKEKYAIIYQWMCENVKYDYEALKGDDRIHSSNGIAQGRPLGTNGTVNALVYGSCVCQGYTKTMELLLKLSDIKSFDILCRAGTRSETKKDVPSMYDGKRHADDTNHSILKVNLDGMIYYSDVTWDAERFQSGVQRKYFLLSQSDISKNHILYNDEGTIEYSQSVSQEEQDKLLKFAEERIKKIDMGLDNQDAVKTSQELFNKFNDDLKTLQEQYGIVGRKIEELMKNNSISPITDYESQLKILMEQRDAIGRKIAPILESQRAFQRQVNNEKEDEHRKSISQVENLLSINITDVTNAFSYDTFNGVPRLEIKDSETLRQELINIHKQLDELYYSGKLDIKNWQTLKSAVSKEYASFISKAPKKNNAEKHEQEQIVAPVEEGQPFLQNLTHEDAEWEVIKQKYNYDGLNFDERKAVEQEYHDMKFKRMMEQLGVDDNLFELESEKTESLEEFERRNVR